MTLVLNFILIIYKKREREREKEINKHYHSTNNQPLDTSTSNTIADNYKYFVLIYFKY
jgi:hypothetical protein